MAHAAASDAGGLDPGLLGDFLDRLAAPDPDHHWDRQATARFAALGARSAEQGVALRALVDLYLSAAWRAWPLLPEVTGSDAAAVRTAGRRVLRICDDAVAALSEGYTAAGRGLMRREESLRREFVEDLLSGTADPAGLLARAQSYGLQLAGPHLVVLADAPTRFHDAGPLLTEVNAALAGPLGTAEALVTTRHGQLVVVLPVLAPDAHEAVLTALRRILVRDGEPTGSPRTSIALGRPRPGPSGVARSYQEAREAVALTRNLRLAEPVVHARDLLIYQVLLRDRPALADLIDTVLTPLLQARGGAKPLMDTLRVYLDSGGNTTRTARELHLSVRAVSYRLDRIGRLTGLHPGDPAHRYTLHTAVLGARALGWPGAANLAEPAQ